MYAAEKPKDKGSLLHRNVGTHLQECTSSQPRRPNLKDAPFGIASELDVSPEVGHSKFRSVRKHIQENKIRRRKSESGDVNIESTWFTYRYMEFVLRKAVREKGKESKQTIPFTP